MTTMRGIILSIAMILAVFMSAADFDPLTADIEANLRNPAVPAKAAQAVSSSMGQLLRTFRGAGYSVQAVRDGQVVVVTIPVVKLFEPCSATLLPDASEELRPLMPYIKRSDNYKVIVAVHSDNTGDSIYSDRLTADRANAVDEFYFNLNNGTDTGIIPYGIGSDEPVEANNSIVGRARNRRVEVYFVPTEEFIDKVRHRR